MKARLEVEVLGEGSAAIPGRLLTDIVRLLPSSDVELEYQPEENTLRVTGGSADYRVRTYSVESPSASLVLPQPPLPAVSGGL